MTALSWPPAADPSAELADPSAALRRAKADYAANGRVLIRDFLSDEDADGLGAIVKAPLPWNLRYRAEGSTRALPESQLVAFDDAQRSTFWMRVLTEARTEFQFAYFDCSLAPGSLAGFEPSHGIHQVARTIFSPAFLEPLKAVVGDPEVRGLTASFTRYDSGHFLLPHDDTDSTDDRRAAYVLNLSEDWWPDWGGLLQFIDNGRNVAETFLPHNGSLALFKVPQAHAVSYVAPHAQRSRYAITGWLVA
ncbi:MAG: 2OG-Fe(II) oxygenase family protein [Caldimonas sp.]